MDKLSKRRKPKGKQALIYKKAVSALEEKNYPLALRLFKEVLRYDEYIELVWYQLGVVEFYQENYREALICFERAIKIDKDFLEAQIAKGDALLKLGYILEGIEHFYEISKNFTDSKIQDRVEKLRNLPQALLVLEGRMFFNEKDFVEALDKFNEFLEQEPQDRKVWRLKGEALFYLGNYKEAKDALVTAVEKGCPLEEVAYTIARSLVKLEKFTEALSFIQHSREFKEDNKEALELRNLCLEELGEFSLKKIKLPPVKIKTTVKRKVVKIPLKKYLLTVGLAVLSGILFWLLGCIWVTVTFLRLPCHEKAVALFTSSYLKVPWRKTLIDKAFNVDDLFMKEAAVYVLSKEKNTSYKEKMLKKCLNSDSLELKIAAIRVTPTLDSEKAIEILQKFMVTKDKVAVKKELILALKKINSPKAQKLIRELKGKSKKY